MDSTSVGYDPEKTIAENVEFIKKLAHIVGMDWQNANVWTRHAELENKIADLAARTQPAQEVPRLTNDEIKKITGASDEYWANSQLFIIAIARAVEAAVLAKLKGQP